MILDTGRMHINVSWPEVPGVNQEDITMSSTITVLEVLSQSEKSWEDAASRAVADVAGRMDVRSVYVHHLEAVVESGKVVQYRINAKLSGIVKNA